MIIMIMIIIIINNNNNPTWLIFEQSMTTGRLDCLTPAFVMVSLQMSHDNDDDDVHDDNDDHDPLINAPDVVY